MAAAAETDKMLREMAKVRGFRLVKSRRRKPGGDYGRYGLTDAKTGNACFGIGEKGLKASAEEIEEFLRGRAQADWKSSLSAPASRPRPSGRKHARRPESEEIEPAPRRPASRRASAGSVRHASPAADAVAPKAKREPRPEPKPAPKPELIVRQATAKDAAGIAALIEADAPSTRKMASTIAALAKQGKPVLVADEGGIVGAVSYDVVMPVHHPAPLGRITFLVTAKPARRRGIGGKLLEQAEARLRKLGCGAFELVNDIELSNANSFLRGRGYHRSGYRFARTAAEK